MRTAARSVAVVTTLALTITFVVTPAAGHDGTGSTTAEPVPSQGPPDKHPNGADRLRPGRSTPSAPHGGCSGMCTMDWQWAWHTHHADAVYSRWDGYVDVNRSDRCYGCTISRTYTTSKGNGWSASIGFDYKVINAKVGYDTSWSTTESVTYSFKVPSGKWGRVVSRDWYHITDMYAHTNYYTELGEVYSTTRGTARGMKWWDREWFLRIG
jgi:hypothetical protein